MSIYS